MMRTNLEIEGPVLTPFRWTARPMRARVDLSDKEALYATLDQADGVAEP
jgi:hypothetical protein